MSDIIGAIDGAIHEFETSQDAMRWVPPDKRTSSVNLNPSARSVPTSHGPVRMWWNGDLPPVNSAGRGLAIRGAEEYLVIQASSTTTDVFNRIVHLLSNHSHECPDCYPRANPKSSTYGPAYRQRQLARRRRRR